MLSNADGKSPDAWQQYNVAIFIDHKLETSLHDMVTSRPERPLYSKTIKKCTIENLVDNVLQGHMAATIPRSAGNRYKTTSLKPRLYL
jgi:hypothetical protein